MSPDSSPEQRAPSALARALPRLARALCPRALAALLVLAGACAPLPPMPPEPHPETRSETRPETPVDARRRLSAEVPVCLSRFERAERAAFEDGAGRVHAFSRRGARLVASDGRRSASFELPAPASGVWRVGERGYSGPLSIRLHPVDGLRVLSRPSLEHYVQGVVAAELVLWSAAPEELRAQAIAARSYALASLETRPFLWDDTRDQVYRGRFQPAPSAAAHEVARRLELAVDSSAGLLLAVRGEVFDARFHAACGGATTLFENVFEKPQAPPTRSVRCDSCLRRGAREPDAREASSGRPSAIWSFTANPHELAQLARSLHIGNRLLSLRPTRADDARRWLEVELSGPQGRTTLDFPSLRRALGPGRLKSGRVLRTWPASGERIEGGLFFEGTGHGHGVGLCQLGAHAMASEEQRTAREILRHYYPEARVVSMYEL